jgi:NAD(P)-dependent dehydrogenase (short-subunit alcohol dehydrogenase family)
VSNSDQAARQAVLTGASSGIGRAIAEHLLAQRWRVLGLDQAAPTIEHPQFEGIQADLGDAAAIGAMRARLTGAHALVHAAGLLRVGTLGSLDLAAGELMWRVHVQAAVALAEAMVPAMVTRGAGRVVLIGSRVAHGMPGRSQYAATKAALIALARSWAAEVAASGVTVNVVSPAATETAMVRDTARAASAPRLPPIGRLIQPSEIAATAAFLLSPEAAAITGQELTVCGGSSLAS